MIKFNYKKGFTLLEALVAISILMVAVAAPITIAQKGLSSAVYSKNQMIASYLAQDAIEYIINQRDQTSINHLTAGNHDYDWNNLNVFSLCKVTDLIALDGVNGLGCQINTIKQVDIVNQNGGDAVSAYSATNYLSEDNTNGFYGYDTGSGFTQTSFTRQIKILLNPNGSNPDEALIYVAVSWGTTDNTVIVKALIYNY